MQILFVILASWYPLFICVILFLEDKKYNHFMGIKAMTEMGVRRNSNGKKGSLKFNDLGKVMYVMTCQLFILLKYSS